LSRSTIPPPVITGIDSSTTVILQLIDIFITDIIIVNIGCTAAVEQNTRAAVPPDIVMKNDRLHHTGQRKPHTVIRNTVEDYFRSYGAALEVYTGAVGSDIVVIEPRHNRGTSPTLIYTDTIQAVAINMIPGNDRDYLNAVVIGIKVQTCGCVMNCIVSVGNILRNGAVIIILINSCSCVGNLIVCN